MLVTSTRADERAVLTIAYTIQPLAVRQLELFGERLRATINSGDKFKLLDCLRRRVLPSCALILPRRTSLIVCDQTTHTFRTFAGTKPAYSPSNVFTACKLCVEKAKQYLGTLYSIAFGCLCVIITPNASSTICAEASTARV
jgi:hypothetical protein